MYVCLFPKVKDVRDHKLDNRMESFFLAETIKYLYLLFDPDNFIHNTGTTFELGGAHGDCILGAGGYIFNTEAHPLDPAALHCCSKDQDERSELQDILLSLTEYYKPSMDQSEAWGNRNSERLSPRERRKAFRLSCPMQSFSARFALLGQVFSDSTWAEIVLRLRCRISFFKNIYIHWKYVETSYLKCKTEMCVATRENLLEVTEDE